MKPAPSVHAARAVVQALAAAGVREVVLAPGSRSAPLAYALADAAREDRPAGAPAVVVHVRLDERDAAFVALGIAKAAAAAGQPRPVAVVTTSGTAVGNLVPAVLEAHHSGTPLLLLTADRPPALRGTGANQTTEQPGLLAPAVRLTLDLVVGNDAGARELEDLAARMRGAVALAARTALGEVPLGADPAEGRSPGDPGPVHVNLAFDDPLVPGDEPWPVDPSVPDGSGPIDFGFVGGGRVPAREGEAGDAVGGAPGLPDGPPTVVVAGDGAGDGARELAEARGWPLLAEPTSGARGGPNAVPAYRVLLDAWPGAREVRRVVVIGRPTLSRPVGRLLARGEVEVVRVQRPSAAWPDAGRSADALLPAIPDAWFVAPAPSAERGQWLDRWIAAGESALRIVREECAVADGAGRAVPRMTGIALADLVARASAPGDVLVVGSSNPVRDLDLVAQWPQTPWTGAPLVISNRGLSGIDGMTATAVGVALTLPDRVVRAVVGDLTFLHDVGGLLTGTLEERAHLQIVVANDDGGSVFATLEHGEPGRAPVFERFFGTPHGADLAALCAGYGVRHRLARDAAEVAESLASPGPGISVLEVRVDRSRRRDTDATIAARIAAELGAG